MIHLKSVSKSDFEQEKQSVFPFSLPFVQNFQSLEFTSPVTFFVGENGAGKSTILEALAVAIHLPIVGSNSIDQDETLREAESLSRYFHFKWTVRPHKGFFLRAEDFFGFTKRLNQLRAELNQEIQRLDAELPDGYGKQLATGSIRGQIEALTQKYGVDLGAFSHGESFLKLFQSRMVPGGLYLLDEPETPLSPLRQLSLLAIIKEMVAKDCQFIIVTHSPIIMAYPDATIYDFNQNPVRQVKYEDLEHVKLTRDFLLNPRRFLQEL